MIGGMARNPGFLACLARQLKVEKIQVPEAPEFGAATGAALLAAETEK
jgi:benzoyl-CoA reductase subunit D